MSMLRWALALAALAAAGPMLVLGPAADVASAHTEPIASMPRAGAVLSKPPKAVTITFAQEIRGGTLVVRRGGAVVSRGSGGKDPANVRRLRVSLRPRLGPGRYVVRWTVRAADGHRQAGSFAFLVR
jgi:methionine-rich copper-binding protein CopC